MIARVIEFLNSIYPLSAELVEVLKANLIYTTFKRKDLILKEGQVCKSIYFVQQGLLRAYYNVHGNDVTSWFMKENDVVTSVTSFFSQKKSIENIEALEDCEMLFLTYDVLQDIYQTHIEFNFIGRCLTEIYYALSEERLFALRNKRARERYQYFEEMYPELLQRVSMRHLASYLGVTVETLSRIRSRY